VVVGHGVCVAAIEQSSKLINQTIELVEKNNFCRYRNRIINSFNLNFEYIKELLTFLAKKKLFQIQKYNNETIN
jgi:hypothetical protein